MRAPRATYRLQFNAGFTFREAEALAPYLAELGVGCLYASPYMEARPGSSHGYDIVDHNALNPEIGVREDYESFVETLHSHGLGQLLDWVPNHMGVGPDNSWWMDVLEHGPASRHARFFDIDWHPENRRELDGKVLLPVLGDHYRSILQNGELALDFDPEDGSFSVSYYEHRCPLDPRTYPEVLRGVSPGETNENAPEFESLVTAFGNLPARGETDEESVAERARDSVVDKERLARLCGDSPEVRRAVEERVKSLNGDPEDPESYERLHRILEEQAYRLVYWRVASDEINYRRFFSVNDLAGLRVEDERVFEETHRLVLELLGSGKVDGIRLDHPDGLYDPAEYFHRLQRAAREATGGEVYVLVEKILASHEDLPEDWPVAGTTGYEFTNLVGGLFVDGRNEAALDRVYRRFIGRESSDFEELLRECKRRVMRGELASELNVLSRRLLRLSEGSERYYDFTISVLRDALREVVAYFPVYRTYITPEGTLESGVSETDRRYVEWAVARAKKSSDAADDSVFDFIRGALLLELEGSERRGEMAASFVGKFQQYTGPVMAKGMEDTALYRFNRLVSLNEVGGEPERFGASVSAFHHENAERARLWPRAMLSTSTHDTKRSEDVRARISTLSELPDEWRAELAKWARANRSRRRTTDEIGPAPSRNDEYLLYQTLLGAWPLQEEFDAKKFTERLQEYMRKAMREAGARTSWTKVDEEYEEAVSEFVRAILTPDENNLFLYEFVPFQRQISRLGAVNSLSQTLLKLTAPGVPDIYQGNELWDFSLVDPDNRRPVDYALRRTLLAEVRNLDLAGVRASLEGGEWQKGLPKLYLTWKSLQLRRERPELFEGGDYLPLEVCGEKSEHLVAFARVLGEEVSITLAPRLCSSLLGEGDGLLFAPESWGDTKVRISSLSEGSEYCEYRNVFTGEIARVEEGCEDGASLNVEEILGDFPVALLVGGERSPDTVG